MKDLVAAEKMYVEEANGTGLVAIGNVISLTDAEEDAEEDEVAAADAEVALTQAKMIAAKVKPLVNLLPKHQVIFE